MSRNSALVLILSVGALLTLGVIMLFSASAHAQDSHGDIYFFLKRQSAWLAIGLVGGVAATFVDYHYWSKISWPLYGVAVVLLALCFVPHIGMRINGSWRWIKFGPVSFQPSELGKLAAIVLLAAWFSKYEKKSGHFLWGFAVPMVLTAVLMALIVREQDMGTTLLIGVVMVAMMFVAGTNLLYMTSLAAVIGGGILFLAKHSGNRSGRMTAFLDLEKSRQGYGLQQWEGLKAFREGGLSGVGLGDSVEKAGYLPYAHTDFIFPIVGEELGLRVTLLVVLAFLLIALCGILISLQARDRFGLLLAFGLTMTITFQAAVNVAVTTALMPNKGMPLPFISAGGSNLCLCLLFVGILLNIYRQGNPEGSGRPPEVAVAARVTRRVTPRL